MTALIKRCITSICIGIRSFPDNLNGCGKVLFCSSFIVRKHFIDIRELNFSSILASTGILIIFLIIILISKAIYKSLNNNSTRQNINSLINGNYNNQDVEVMKRLTQRESEIYNLRVSGKTNKEIAQILNINLCTVKTHINNLLKKIQAI
jgi:two-component system, sensor histidine kinase LadS